MADFNQCFRLLNELIYPSEVVTSHCVEYHLSHSFTFLNSRHEFEVDRTSLRSRHWNAQKAKWLIIRKETITSLTYDLVPSDSIEEFINS